MFPQSNCMCMSQTKNSWELLRCIFWPNLTGPSSRQLHASGKCGTAKHLQRCTMEWHAKDPKFASTKKTGDVQFFHHGARTRKRNFAIPLIRDELNCKKRFQKKRHSSCDLISANTAEIGWHPTWDGFPLPWTANFVPQNKMKMMTIIASHGQKAG